MAFTKIFVKAHYMRLHVYSSFLSPNIIWVPKKATEPWIIVSYELKSVLTEIDKKLVKSRIYILIYYIH
jgi:hypothetical protein